MTRFCLNTPAIAPFPLVAVRPLHLHPACAGEHVDTLIADIVTFDSRGVVALAGRAARWSSPRETDGSPSRVIAGIIDEAGDAGITHGRVSPTGGWEAVSVTAAQARAAAILMGSPWKVSDTCLVELQQIAQAWS